MFPTDKVTRPKAEPAIVERVQTAHVKTGMTPTKRLISTTPPVPIPGIFAIPIGSPDESGRSGDRRSRHPSKTPGFGVQPDREPL